MLINESKKATKGLNCAISLQLRNNKKKPSLLFLLICLTTLFAMLSNKQ